MSTESESMRGVDTDVQTTKSDHDVYLRLHEQAQVSDYYAVEIAELIGFYSAVRKVRAKDDDEVRITFDGGAVSELDRLRDAGYHIVRLHGKPGDWAYGISVTK